MLNKDTQFLFLSPLPRSPLPPSRLNLSVQSHLDVLFLFMEGGGGRRGSWPVLSDAGDVDLICTAGPSPPSNAKHGDTSGKVSHTHCPETVHETLKCGTMGGVEWAWAEYLSFPASSSEGCCTTFTVDCHICRTFLAFSLERAPFFGGTFRRRFPLRLGWSFPPGLPPCSPAAAGAAAAPC